MAIVGLLLSFARVGVESMFSDFISSEVHLYRHSSPPYLGFVFVLQQIRAQAQMQRIRVGEVLGIRGWSRESVLSC